MPGAQGKSASKAPCAWWIGALAILPMAIGCPGPSRPVGIKPAPAARSVRDIRVLLGVSRSTVRLRVPGKYTIRTCQGRILTRGAGLPWSIVSGGAGIELGGRQVGDARIEIVPEPGGVVVVSRVTRSGWSVARQYGGDLRLLAQGDGAVKVINVVDVETYVAGVLPGELYPGFSRESFRTQAIAARTYALYEMSTTSRVDYDVTAGEGSQVYEGASDTAVYREACAAVKYTRGMVCTWTSSAGERIFCTFFSSACGGTTQSVSDGKSMHNIPPLAGGVRCDYCRIAKGEAYRWKPRSIRTAELMSRLTERYPEAAKLGRLRDVRVLRRTAGGRARLISLVGETGRTMQLPGENFRLAVGSRVMRSTNCRICLDGDSLVFEDGKGFGHGMGLCQWGMEGQARLGRTAAQILRHYYPQSHLTRAY